MREEVRVRDQGAQEHWKRCQIGILLDFRNVFVFSTIPSQSSDPKLLRSLEVQELAWGEGEASISCWGWGWGLCVEDNM